MAPSDTTQSPVVINLEREEVYECGAMLLAVLTFPEPAKVEQRQWYHHALCGHALRTLMQSDEWAWQPRRLKAGYLLLSEARQRNAFRTSERRLRDRLRAAHMAMAFAKQSAGPLPKGRRQRLSLNSEAARLVTTTGEHTTGLSDPHDAERRIWRTSLPVIHIACAVADFIVDCERLGHRLEASHFLSEPLFIRQVVLLSNYYADLLLTSPSLRLDPATLIRLVLDQGDAAALDGSPAAA